MKVTKYLLRLSLIVAIFACFPYESKALDISGRWFIDANGWHFHLYINQSGEKISGRMIAINNSNPESIIDGNIEDGKIRFTRSAPYLRIPQQYEGFLIYAGKLKGVFCHENECKYSWFAEKEY